MRFCLECRSAAGHHSGCPNEPPEREHDEFCDAVSPANPDSCNDCDCWCHTEGGPDPEPRDDYDFDDVKNDYRYDPLRGKP